MILMISETLRILTRTKMKKNNNENENNKEDIIKNKD